MEGLRTRRILASRSILSGDWSIKGFEHDSADVVSHFLLLRGISRVTVRNGAAESVNTYGKAQRQEWQHKK